MKEIFKEYNLLCWNPRGNLLLCFLHLRKFFSCQHYILDNQDPNWNKLIITDIYYSLFSGKEQQSEKTQFKTQCSFHYLSCFPFLQSSLFRWSPTLTTTPGKPLKKDWELLDKDFWRTCIVRFATVWKVMMN